MELRLPCLTMPMSISFEEERCAYCSMPRSMMEARVSIFAGRTFYVARKIVDISMINGAFHNLSNAGAPDIQLHYMALIGKVSPVIMNIFTLLFFFHIIILHI